MRGPSTRWRAVPCEEEPLHLIPPSLRPVLKEQYGIEIEGEMNPRNRHLLRTKYKGNIAEMPVERVVFSENEAVGIGYYVATNPNADSSLLVGSVDTGRLEGSRTEVAGKAFRMDGEFNVANRGLIELVEMFKADRHLLTTLLGLAQEQVIKMEKFGSIYADEVIIGHSNEGDFNTFAEDEHSEALKDRITAVQVPYNLRVSEDVKIYEKVMAKHQDTGVSIAPLAPRVAATYAVLSRLHPPSRQGTTLLDKMRLYDGRMVGTYTRQDVIEMKQDHVGEGMRGISPRYVMNRIAAVASAPGVKCVTPLAVLDSLWRGITENVSLDQAGREASINLIVDTVSEYNQLAISEIQRAYQDSFDDSAELMLAGYLRNVRTFCSQKASNDDYDEQEMQEMERAIGIRERDKAAFRREIDSLAALYERRERRMTYTADPRLKAAIEARLFPSVRALTTALARPRLKRLREEWNYRRILMVRRLMEKYGYCGVGAEDLLEYVTQLLQKKTMLKTTKKADLSWQWDLYPRSEALSQTLSPRSAGS